MDVLETVIRVIQIVCAAFSAMYFLYPLYTVVGLFTTRRFAAAKKNHRYAVMIAARNEEAVIPKLIDSILAQDYPRELVDIFVVADNCDDATARVAREHGAVCYERFDNDHRTKGFALQYLVECIRRDYGIDSYEGYFIFDADNLLKKDYITRMNEAFDSGEKIVTSYRNTKNFDSNWIAASYGIHWLRTIRFENRARSFFHLAVRVQGTGFLFAAELIRDGWNYTGFTEDRAFCADAVAKGYKISYNDRAEFYDEQPVSMKIAIRQRIRWAKGHLQAVAETGPKLFSHIFVTKGAANRHLSPGEGSRFVRLRNNLRMRLMSYDMMMVVLPRSLVSVFQKLSLFILKGTMICMALSCFSPSFVSAFTDTLFRFFGITLAPDSLGGALVLFTLLSLMTAIPGWISNMAMAAYVFISERRRIMHIKWYKKLWYCLTFPIFGYIGDVSTCIALFKRVEWKPIPHNADMSIEELSGRMRDKEYSTTGVGNKN